MVLGMAIFAAAVVGVLAFLAAARTTEPVLIAARDLPAGHTIEAADLTVSEVKLDGPLALLAISEVETIAVIGRTLSSPVHAGEMIVWPDLASGTLIGPNEVGITVPVSADAVYSGLRPGQAVAVLATRDVRTPNSQTVTLLDHAVVYEMTREPGRIAVSRSSDGSTEERGLTNVTLVVPRAEAERLAHAVVNWEITLAILPPESGER